MFSQRKSFWRGNGKWFAIAMVALLAFGWWINRPSSETVLEGDPIVLDHDQQASAEQNVGSLNGDKSAANKNSDKRTTGATGGINSDDFDDPDDTDDIGDEELNEEPASYYLIKEEDQSINIYFYDDSGKERFVRSTDIPWELLSAEDQDMFSEGIVRHSQEELSELMQDFES